MRSVVLHLPPSPISAPSHGFYLILILVHYPQTGCSYLGATSRSHFLTVDLSNYHISLTALITCCLTTAWTYITCCPSLPPSASVCLCLPPSASVCLRLPPSASVCLRLPPSASVCLRLPPSASVCLRLPPSASVCLLQWSHHAMASVVEPVGCLINETIK